MRVNLLREKDFVFIRPSFLRGGGGEKKTWIYFLLHAWKKFYEKTIATEKWEICIVKLSDLVCEKCIFHLILFKSFPFLYGKIFLFSSNNNTKFYGSSNGYRKLSPTSTFKANKKTFNFLFLGKFLNLFSIASTIP